MAWPYRFSNSVVRSGQATGLLSSGVFSSTIFEEMSYLANQYEAINLGQGFPDTDGPRQMFDAAIQAMTEGHNQYSTIVGDPVLRKAIAEHQRRFYGQNVNPDTQITVTAGASEALAATVASLVQSGDEVVVFEPYYDLYPAAIAKAGGILKTVPLLPPSFEPDLTVLENSVNCRTAAIIFNDPHNPTGTIFSREAKQKIVDLAEKYDAFIIQDAVYEHLYFTHSFEPIFLLNGAEERSIFISAISKTHSLTGWRVGWIIGPEYLSAPLRLIKGYMSHSAATPLQIGAAAGVSLSDSFYKDFRERYRKQKNILCTGLADSAFKLCQPSGTFFAAACISDLLDQRNIASSTDLARILPREAGVAVIPMTAFVTDTLRNQMRSWVRFAFCKRAEVLEDAVKRLQNWLA